MGPMIRRGGMAIAVSALLAVACVQARAESERVIVSLPAENFGFLPFYVAQDAVSYTHLTLPTIYSV